MTSLPPLRLSVTAIRFDRMLIAQAQQAELVLMTGDQKFRLYDVATMAAG